MVEAIRQGDIPGVQLRRRQALPLPPEAAWTWLVEPAKLALWLADEAEVQPGPRGSLALRGVGEGGEPCSERGRTLELVPPRHWLLAFERMDARWGVTTRLALDIHPAPAGCEIDILQIGFQRLPLSICLTAWETYRRRSRTALERLAAAAG